MAYAIVSIQLNMITYPAYPEKLKRDIVVAPFLLLSVVIVPHLLYSAQLPVCMFSLFRSRWYIGATDEHTDAERKQSTVLVFARSKLYREKVILWSHLIETELLELAVLLHHYSAFTSSVHRSINKFVQHLLPGVDGVAW